MVFFICLCISLIYCYLLGIHQSKGTFTFSAYIFALAPLLILWILISGMQYYVGQDYPHYIDIFNGKYIDRYEPGFKAIIFLCHHFGIKGQSIY